MSVNARSTVVGVFRDRAMAEQALDALKNAGFHRDQIRYSGSTTGGFLGDIKNLFSTQETTNDNFTNDLANMGFSDEETRYYTNEYHNGNTLVAVNAPGHEQEALNLLHQHGAYNSNVNPSVATAAATTVPIQQSLDQRSAQNYSAADANRPMTPPNAQPYTSRDNQPVASTATNRDPQRQAAQPRATQESYQGADVTSREAQLQARQAELQTQLQSAQQQLRDAQAQLQALKQREAQMQAYKQHETQLHTTEKQLQDTQAQLQTTLAELRAAQTRINGQPNQ